jgi:hypothetical protein
MCGQGITSTAIAAQLPFNQERRFSACSALATLTAISGADMRFAYAGRFHGNVRAGHNHHGNCCAIAFPFRRFGDKPAGYW